MLSPNVPIVLNLPNTQTSAEIYTVADMHTGSAQFDLRRWNELEKLLQQPNAYVIFAGDQHEMATRTSKSDVYTQTMSPSEQKRWWIERLRNYADKIICIIDGNHEFNRASKDADQFPLYDIALMLGIEDRYRSEAAFVDIGIGKRRPTDGTQWRYFGYVVHKAQNLVNYSTADGIEGIDFFVSGHTHKPTDKPLGKLVYDSIAKSVRERSVENIVCGSFLTYGGYAQRFGYRPTSQKQYKLVLSGTSKAIQTVGFYL